MTSHCPSCERYMPRDEADVWDSDGPYCGGCTDRAMQRFCKDFVHEAIFEDAGERSVFFAKSNPLSIAAE